MKLLELDLCAFGPFTGLKIDFSSPAEALHVVYGPNEAGKSTALRAVRGLLYGIPARTSDAHLHPPQNLRIGARLSGPGGALMTVVRRKGLRNTLLDPDGNPVDEAALQKLCGGVSEAVFATMFGLDHETLRQGGEALLEGGGEIGKSLLGAALGGTGLHQVLRELTQEADSLFTPQAQKKPLNEALRAFAEANKRARLEPTTSEAWTVQKRGVEESIGECERLEREVRALREQRLRLARAARTLPLLAERMALTGRRKELGEVVRLPPTATRQREDTERYLAEAAAQEQRLVAEMHALETERARLHVPASMRSPADEVAARLPELEQLRGSHDKAALDLPRIRADLERTETAARAVLRRIGKKKLSALLGVAEEGAVEPDALPLATLDAIRLDSATQAKVAKMAASYPLLAAVRAQAAADLAARCSKRDALRKRRDALPHARDVAPLARALSAAQRQGDLDERVEAAERSADRIARAADLELRALGLGDQSLATAATLPVPSLETVQRHDQRFADLEAREVRRAERARLVGERVATTDADLEAMRRSGDVPTEEGLVAARARRDALWSTIRAAAAAAGGEPAPARKRATPRPRADETGDATAREDRAAFEAAMHEADAIADRLRREAERVSRQARLLADRNASTAELAALENERDELSRQHEDARRTWTEIWAAAATSARAPAEMRTWLSRHARLAGQLEQLTEAQHEVTRLCAARDERTAALHAALRDAGAQLPAEAGLATSIDEARRTLAALEQTARQREELSRGAAELEIEIDAAAHQLAAAERALSEWKQSWASAAKSLGLSPDAEPEEATATLSALADLFPLVDEALRLERRAIGIERDADDFADLVRALVATHAPDLSTEAAEAASVSRAAAELYRRWQQARTDLVESEQLARQIADKRAVLGEQRSRRAQAEATLRVLFERAGVTDVTALVKAERRAEAAGELETRMREVDDQLRVAGEGLSLEVLVADTEGLTVDGVGAELERLETQIEDTERALSRAQRDVGVREAGVRDLETRSEAADAAAEAEQRLARVRDLAERWVRVRLAAAVLARETERYRQQNQGPVLARASELFARLTLGSYQSLRAGWGDDDRAVLRCVRADGQERGVDALSDGARDQLYLALRIASLERHAAACGDAMPLIVDDILVHFDDDRARASLTALGELADTTQILFFTHHQRLLELAREAVPPGRLVEHRLG